MTKKEASAEKPTFVAIRIAHFRDGDIGSCGDNQYLVFTGAHADDKAPLKMMGLVEAHRDLLTQAHYHSEETRAPRLDGIGSAMAETFIDLIELRNRANVVEVSSEKALEAELRKVIAQRESSKKKPPVEKILEAGKGTHRERAPRQH